ncbi:hypothetical protein [Halopiger thermotolerans]|jgi:hypothetical protein
MVDYEVEYGPVTERYDARTGEVFAVDVETYIQEANSNPVAADPSRGECIVRFDIEDDVAVFRECETQENSPTTRRTINAITAAAAELRELEPDYRVPDPLEAIQDDSITSYDTLP